jgi:cation:H+ antiporter
MQQMLRSEVLVILVWGLLIVIGVVLIVWGAETFAEHLGAAAVRLRVSSFALALLLAGAEPEELATAVAASLRDAPAIAFGDVVGANIAICLVALGVGAWIAPLPFSNRVMRYALFSLPIGVVATGFIWDGEINRPEGLFLIGLYVLYVAIIWWVERKPPALGETGELAEAAEELASEQAKGIQHRVGKDLLLVFAGFAAMIVGSVLLVEAVRQISQVEATQTKLALTLVGFATAFELVILAWSTARRGATEAAVAGVVGSFAYNLTMTLGAAAIARPLRILDASLLHFPLIAMLGSLTLVIVLASFRGYLNKTAGLILLAAYPLFLVTLLIA